MTINKFGLKRYIESKTRREVRRNSRYGCIICRELYCHYHHFDPEFQDAKEHRADGICLLCPNHHGLVDSGRLLNSTIAENYARIRQQSGVGSPKHREIILGSLVLGLGNSKFDFIENGGCLLDYGGQPVLSISHIFDDFSGQYRPSLDGTLCDRDGVPILSIEDNTFVVESEQFDVEMVGREISFRDNISNKKPFQLKITFQPPSTIIIDRLIMMHRDIVLNFDRNFSVTVPAIDLQESVFSNYEFSLPEAKASGVSKIVSYNPWGRFVPAIAWEKAGIGNIEIYGVSLARGYRSATLRSLSFAPST